MDYQVFLVSRMAEEWSHTRDNARSVLAGQTETARVITAAASIMIAVFIAFVFMGQRERRRVRHRAGRRRGAGRLRPADGARTGRDAPVRPGQLVAAPLAGPPPAAPGHRAARAYTSPTSLAPRRNQELTDRADWPLAEHRYRSTSLRQTGDGWVLDRELTLHGFTRQVPLAGFTATAQINRGDFSIDRWTGGAVVGDKVQVSLKIETVLQQ